MPFYDFWFRDSSEQIFRFLSLKQKSRRLCQEPVNFKRTEVRNRFCILCCNYCLLILIILFLDPSVILTIIFCACFILECLCATPRYATTTLQAKKCEFQEHQLMSIFIVWILGWDTSWINLSTRLGHQLMSIVIIVKTRLGYQLN